MSKPLLLVDRDGTIIVEPENYQIDAYEKLAFVEGVIPALLAFQKAGWDLIMVSNQDGLGSPAFPRENFEGPHHLMMQILESQGIRFSDVLIDTSFAHENKMTRKPNIGLMTEYLKSPHIDWSRSLMIGDRNTDIEFAKNLGIRAYKLASPQFSDGEYPTYHWAEIARLALHQDRTAVYERKTKETQIQGSINLDQAGKVHIQTGLAFFDHMLEQIGLHAGISLNLVCQGDLQVDEHHTVEDCAISLGHLIKQAIGNKQGIQRYGFLLPMDESLTQIALDFSGRAYCTFSAQLNRERVGDLPTELVPHFFKSLSDAAQITLNIQTTGENDHHQIESMFKALGRCLRQAIAKTSEGLPSSKGVL